MKNTPVTLGILLLVVIGIGIYIATNDNDTNSDVNQPGTTTDQMPTVGTPTTSTPATSTGTTTSTTTAPRAVDIKDFAYTPATLTIKRGTRVTWTNRDTAPHDVTSVSGNLLASPRLSTGQAFSFTFTTPGTYNYYCTIHPNMRATVVVTE